MGNHANWQCTYAGVELPKLSRNGLREELQPIDLAERNAYGELMLEVVADKVRVSCTFLRLNGEQVHDLMSTLKKNRTGEFTYYSASEGGIRTIDAYYGAGAPSEMLLYDDDMELQRYSSVTINFIQR